MHKFLCEALNAFVLKEFNAARVREIGGEEVVIFGVRYVVGLGFYNHLLHYYLAPALVSVPFTFGYGWFVEAGSLAHAGFHGMRPCTP